MTMRSERKDVTLCIPTIPPRRALLARCLSSWVNQTYPVHAFSIAVDNDKQGAGPTRNRAMAAARTTWVAFCDDDDVVDPEHLELLLDTALANDVDVVWPWFRVQGGNDPVPMHYDKQWDPTCPHVFPVVTLVRTQAILDADARFLAPSEDHGDDFAFWCRLSDCGARFLHVPQRTWTWHHDSGNTSGLPWCW